MVDDINQVDFPPGWRRKALGDITTFDKSKLDTFMGLRVAVFTIIPMAVGLITSNVSAGLVFALGTYLLSTDETKSPDSWRTVKILLVAVMINAIALALGTLVGMTGWYGVPLFGLGFFLASFIAIYADTTVIGLVACVLFSVGVGLPGGGTVAAAGDRFVLCLLAGLWAMLGVILEMAARRRTALKMTKAPRRSSSSTIAEKLQPLGDHLLPEVRSSTLFNCIWVGGSVRIDNRTLS